MTKSHEVLPGPLVIAIFAIAFCIWSALGNDVNFCVTTGCTLYQDFSVMGISLWWYGASAFTILAACALLGQKKIGQWFGAIFVFGDIFLLLLLALTSPCISCLAAAFLFALCYFIFRRANSDFQKTGPRESRRTSILLWIWLILFITYIGAVAKSQFDVWPILDESGDAKIKMFFSPSCPYCIDGINVLSGNINVAFYPIAENERDVYRLAKIKADLAEGMSLAEAVGQSEEAAEPGMFESFSPEMLLLRFRLLRNKAHIFSSGYQAVPFFETRGLPGDVMARLKEKDKPVKIEQNQGAKDYSLPDELDVSDQCGGVEPCPPRS